MAQSWDGGDVNYQENPDELKIPTRFHSETSQRAKQREEPCVGRMMAV